MNNLLKLDFRRLRPGRAGGSGRQPGGTVVGLAFDGSRVEGVWVKRTNGAVEIRSRFASTLSLDPLTAEPALVGRELRKQLDAAEVRERRCVVGLPLNWALTLLTKLPDLPEPDQESFLQLEAERGLPYAPDTLMLARSRFRSPTGGQYALLVAVPRDHLNRLEALLAAAQLKPVSFGLGIAALQPPGAETSAGVMALLPGEHNLSVQVSLGGGAAVLRTVEGAFELEGAERRLQVEHVFRELRITLGQLPSEFRDSAQGAVKRLRLFGAGDAAEELAEQLASRLTALGVTAEPVKRHAPEDFPVQLPAEAAVSPALSLAVRHLAGQPTPFEFLPPKVSAWQQLAARYASKKLVPIGAGVGALALGVGLAFLVQQARLWYWRGQWSGIQARVTELKTLHRNTQTYRPYFDESFRTLMILRRLTEAFPEDGTVSAKRIEIREAPARGEPPLVICSGTARSSQALSQVIDKLSATRGIAAVHREQQRGASPIQFTFNFRWEG